MDPLYEHCSATIEELDEHTLFLTIGGDAQEEDISELFEVFQPLVAERAPARILVDASRLGETTLKVRWAVLKQIRANKPLVERSAIYGLSEHLETLLRIALRLSGRTNIQTFLWRHEADAWLHQDY